MITPEQRSLDMMKTGRFGNSKGYFKIFTIFLSFLKDFFSLLYQKVVRRGGARAGGRIFLLPWLLLEDMRSKKITEIDSLKNFFCEKFVINANLGRTRNTKKVRWRRVDSLKILHFFRTVLPGQNICASILEVFIK